MKPPVVHGTINGEELTVIVKVTRDYIMDPRQLFDTLLGSIAETLAKQYVEAFGAEVLARVTPGAVANLTAVAAGRELGQILATGQVSRAR